MAGSRRFWGKPPRLRISGGQHQAGTAELAGRLISADVEHDVAALDALRHDGRDAEIERAVEIVDDVLAGEILREIAEPHLEAGMHVRANQRGHHGPVAKVDARCARGQGDLVLANCMIQRKLAREVIFDAISIKFR